MPEELTVVAERLTSLGKDQAQCVQIVRGVTDSRHSQQPVFAIKEALHNPPGDALERVLLTYAVQEFESQLDLLPVHARVILIMRKEFQSYRKAPGSKPALLAGTDPFVTACKIATGRRFPAGPMDWVRGGIPRSWLAKMEWRKLPGVLQCLLGECGGTQPVFYLHLAPAPRNRSLVIPAEVHRAYYRMARSLELQPEIKAVATASWFHDPEMLRITPHIAPLNAPYLEWGGRILASIGEAPADSGFLDYNPERRKLYESGELRPRATLAVWPRQAAIRWAQQHPELDH
jgi:hypothetical protein